MPEEEGFPLSDEAVEAAAEAANDVTFGPTMTDAEYWNEIARASIQAFLTAEGFEVERARMRRTCGRCNGRCYIGGGGRCATCSGVGTVITDAYQTRLVTDWKPDV